MSEAIPAVISFGTEGKSLNQLTILLGIPWIVALPEDPENCLLHPSNCSRRELKKELDGADVGGSEGGGKGIH